MTLQPQERDPALNPELTDEVAKETTRLPPFEEACQIQTTNVGTVEKGRFDAGEGVSLYKTLGRWQTAIIFITNEVGIGILSLPTAMQDLGLIPGIIAIVALGLLTTYTAYVLVQFFRRYPHVLNVVDCFQIIGGKPVAVICAIVFILNLALTCASATLTMSIAFNTMTEHALCTVGFIAFSTVGCWLLCIPRKFKFVSDFGIPCTISVFAAVLIVMISLGIGNRPQRAPPGWDKEIVLVGNPSFQQGFTACLNIAFAYAGNQGFITVMAEMEDASRDFTPALLILQSFAIPMYTVVGAVIYAMAGQYVTSPALGSAPIVPAKIAYGVLFPCLLGTGLVFGHTAIKYLYVLVMRNVLHASHELTSNSPRAWTTWIGLGTLYWLLAFVLANSIPVFNSILSVSSALFVAWFTFGISGVFWLYMNWNEQFSTWRKTSLAILNWTLVFMTIFCNGAGLWAAVSTLVDIFNDPLIRIDRPFTCSDNSIF